MRVLIFGTYDETSHPRVRVLREGLAAHGANVQTCNASLRLGTAERIRLVRSPWRAPAFVVRVVVAWARLVRRSRQVDVPDVVVIGYLGTFDVHLARLLFRRSTLVLDELASLRGTAEDRRLGNGGVRRLLGALDRAARRRADLVLRDTEEHAADDDSGTPSVVVPVGAPLVWLRTQPAAPPLPGDPVRVIFFGLYTPLQGAVVIAQALRQLDAGTSLSVTMVGDGQERGQCQRLASSSRVAVRWIDWIDAAELPDVVAEHHVCLGIFGTGTKAQHVVPNKVFQGAAAGCAIVTSDTPPQRRLLDGAGFLVPPGDPAALVAQLTYLAGDRSALQRAREHARAWAAAHADPGHVVRPLREALTHWSSDGV